MSAITHGVTFSVDDDGWDIGLCECGWVSPPCPGVDIASDFYTEHVGDVSDESPGSAAESILRKLVADGLVWAEDDDGSRIAAFDYTGATLVAPLRDDEAALLRQLCEDELSS